jgi:hypothetical protein
MNTAVEIFGLMLVNMSTMDQVKVNTNITSLELIYFGNYFSLLNNIANNLSIYLLKKKAYTILRLLCVLFHH